MSLWKQVERKIAAIVGGKRVPVSGRQRGDAPDIEHEWLSLEVKHRKQLPEWQKEAMRQAIACNPGDKLPMVVLHEKGMNYRECIVQIRLSDFEEWFIK